MHISEMILGRLAVFFYISHIPPPIAIAYIFFLRSSVSASRILCSSRFPYRCVRKILYSGGERK